jgi:hypothetical protein
VVAEDQSFRCDNAFALKPIAKTVPKIFCVLGVKEFLIKALRKCIFRKMGAN